MFIQTRADFARNLIEACDFLATMRAQIRSNNRTMDESRLAIEESRNMLLGIQLNEEPAA